MVAGGAWAQRGGGGMRGGGGGGFHGGGAVARGGFTGGGMHGGFTGGGYRGGVYGGGFHGYNGFRGYNGFYGNRAYFGIGFGGYGWSGYGWGYGYPYYSYPYYSYPYVGGYWPGYSDIYPYDYGYGAGYASPASTVVIAPQQTAPPVYYVERANPVSHDYDQYGQEVKGSASGAKSSPIYLFAFQDRNIRAAASYWVDGRTLHYVTLQHEERQASLDSLDRALTLQLNRERQVTVQLP